MYSAATVLEKAFLESRDAKKLLPELLAKLQDAAQGFVTEGLRVDCSFFENKLNTMREKIG